MSFGEDSKKSDFDDSDIDLDSLLADDDDAIGKKVSSPKKSSDLPVTSKSSLEESAFDKFLGSKAAETAVLEKEDSTPGNIFNKNSPKRLVTRNKSRESFDDDDDFLSKFKFDNDSKKTLKPKEKLSPVKNNDSLLSEESKYLDELKFNELSPASISKNLTDDSLLKAKISNDDDDFGDDEDDILENLGFDDKEKPVATSKKSGGSFLDDFLKLSPEHKEKNVSNIQSTKNVEKEIKEPAEEDDIIGSYIPAVTKKSENISNEGASSSRSRRGSLFKQVSFKDIPETSPELNASTAKKAVPESPAKTVPTLTKDNSLDKSDSKSKVLPKTKRSERLGAKEDDTDWLNFFKGSPKKSGKSSEKDKAVEEKRTPENAARLSTRRRSSGGEWLGLSESKFEIQGTVDMENSKPADDWLRSEELPKSARPKTADEAPHRSRRQKNVGSTIDTSWLGTDLETEAKSVKGNVAEKLRAPPSLQEEANSFSTSLDAAVLKDAAKRKIEHPVGVPQRGDSALGFTGFQDGGLSKQHEDLVIQSQSFSNIPVLSSASLPSNVTKYHQPSHPQNHPNVNLIPADVYHSLQSKLTDCMLEKDRLSKMSENLKLTYEEKIKSIDALHKNQIAAQEESFKVKEISLKTEFDAKFQAMQEKLKLEESEKKQLEMNVKTKLESNEEERKKEGKRLKELHSQSIELMKQDHEEALLRLKRLKEQEIEAILSSQVHSRSLQHLTDQLEARASELASLQAKVEGRSQAVLLEKQALLESKEKELKALQSRVEHQLEDSDEERSRLQQLVLRLESRLQKTTMEGEEDRWEVQRMKSKLTIQQKHLEEEYKLHQHQIEKEKEKLKISQDSLLHEQKTVIMQLAQERQQLTQEKIEVASLAKKMKEDDAKLNIRKLKEESMLEAQKRALQQEESKLHFEREQERQSSQQLEREADSLRREQLHLKEEREKLAQLQSSLRRRTHEVEEMAMRTSEEREQCRLECEAATRIKTEHQSRLQHYAQQMQMLMEKERQILEEKKRLAEEKIELENKKNSMLCNKCKVSTELPVNSYYNPNNAPSSIVPAWMPQAPVLNGISGGAPLLGKDPSLVVWYVTAQRDREFLQDELAFLQSLKDSSRNKRSE